MLGGSDKLKVEYRAVDALVPYARNPRTHSDEQIAQIAGSIREFDFTNPVLVDGENGIIAGHGRVLAARKLGMDKVPVIELRGLSEAQKRAYVIADNKLAENAGWDEELLAAEFGELQGLGFELGLTGFSLDEIAGIEAAVAAAGAQGDPDATAEPPERPVAIRGDLWALGRHRVLCGDATVATDVARVMGGIEPHLMVTDPPYGVEYDPDWRNRADRANGKPYGASAVGLVPNDDRSDWREVWALFPGDVVYCWAPPGPNQFDFYHSLVESGFEIRMQIIWAKPRHVIGRGNYHVRHEPCLYAVRKGATGHWQGSRTENTVWDIEHRKSETGHSTQKPVECMRRPIVNNSKPGDAVYDPFVGSGTTIIAAQMEGRIAYALDIEPGYVDVSIRRWQKFTSERATLDGDGRTFEEIAAERLAAAA